MNLLSGCDWFVFEGWGLLIHLLDSCFEFLVFFFLQNNSPWTNNKTNLLVCCVPSNFLYKTGFLLVMLYSQTVQPMTRAENGKAQGAQHPRHGDARRGQDFLLRVPLDQNRDVRFRHGCLSNFTMNTNI